MTIVDVFAQSPPLFITAAVLFGLLVGSFLNVVIHRLPLMMEREEHAYCRMLLSADDGDDDDRTTEALEPFNLWTPRSRCPHCDHAITAVENLPVISYLLQRGRCRGCGASISAQYPLVELFTGLTAGFCAWQFGFSWQAGAAILLSFALIALSGIDFKTQLLPDSITLPFLWIGLALALVPVFADLESAVIGAIAGYLSLWSVYWVFKLITGKEGMGYGDFKLLALLGAWLGWQYLLAIIILSSLVGAVVGILLMLLRRRDHSIPMPFGPFLAAAGWLALFYGDALITFYNRSLGI